MQVQRITNLGNTKSQIKNVSNPPNYMSKVNSDILNDSVSFSGRDCVLPETKKMFDEVLELMLNKRKKLLESLTTSFKEFEKEENVAINVNAIPEFDVMKLKGKLNGEEFTFENDLAWSDYSKTIPYSTTKQFLIKVNGKKDIAILVQVGL